MTDTITEKLATAATRAGTTPGRRRIVAERRGGRASVSSAP